MHHLKYVVPGMKLIPQSKTNACWFASAQMVVQWRNRRGRFCILPSPAQVPSIHLWEVHNQTITNPQVIQLAKSIGLKTVFPASFSLAGIEELLRKHGPLWTNGVSHIVVIAGVDQAAEKSWSTTRGRLVTGTCSGGPTSSGTSWARRSIHSTPARA